MMRIQLGVLVSHLSNIILHDPNTYVGLAMGNGRKCPEACHCDIKRVKGGYCPLESPGVIVAFASGSTTLVEILG